MKRNTLTLLLIITFTSIGLFLRFYKNSDSSVSLNIDEVSYGYSAYSILKTGRDENGVFMPLIFRSTGDYKNPVLIYSLVPSIAIFGLNEFSIRFTTALFGALTIPVFYLFLLSFTKSGKIALIGSALLAVSPWHIFYSRFASDQLVALFLLILGMWFFQKMLTGQRIWAILASISLVLSMYTYHTNRLFTPAFLLMVIILNIKNLAVKKGHLVIFILIGLILLLPLVNLSIFGNANVRASMVFLAQDIDYTRYVILDHIQRSGEIFLLFFFWIKRYLNYFQPDFLFFTGLNMTTPGILGLGVLHFFELPWLLLGIIELIRKKIRNRLIIIVWIAIGLIPASITNNEQNTGRSLLILPMLILLVTLGALRFFHTILEVKNKYLRIGILGTYSFFIVITLINSFLVFAVHFPKQKGEAFMEGTKETVLYALQNKDRYQEIVYDPYRGLEAQYIVNIPYMYILFYSQYDPNSYQKLQKRHGQDLFGFDKFTIRRIDWREDRKKIGTLFIGSPWSLPEKDIKDKEILKKIYLSGGQLALLIVSPQK